jgi:outer membrane protein
VKRFILLLIAIVSSGFSQTPMHLTLADAQRLAAQNNPQVPASRLEAAAAHQVAPQYRAALQPNFSGSFTTAGADNGSRLAAGYLNNPAVYSRLASGLWASQLITDFGRTGNLASSADLQAQSRDQAVETTRANILVATAQAYFAVLRAQALVRVANDTVRARQQVSDQVTALAENKIKSDFDVSLANVNLGEARLLQSQATNDLKSAQVQLASIMGLPNLPVFDLQEEPLPQPLPPSTDAMVQEAAQNRPELKDLRLQQAAAERFAKAEHALYFPTVGVAASAGLAPEAYSAVDSRYGAIALNINIPVFNGGLFKARTAEATLKAQAASQNVADLQNRILRDVRVAYVNAMTAADRLTLTAQLLVHAKLGLELAQSRYDLGLSTIVELSQAQLNLTSAQIADASALYDYQSLRTFLDFQAGRLK